MARYLLTVALNAAVDTTYTFESFAVGGIHTVAQMSRVAGGKANNVARVAHALGAPVVATGLAGGQAGAFIQGALAAEGIQVEYEELPGESRTCFALVERSGKSLTEIRERGPEVPAAALSAFLVRYERLLEGAAYVVLAGSLPPGAPSDLYGRLISLARARGLYALLDASGAALAEALAAGPDLVKPNREELAAWVGRPLQSMAELREAAQAMREAGARAVALSLGPEGLLYVGPEGTWSLNPPATVPVNTVGSGDSLVAGLVAGLMQGLSLPEALRLGVAAGTANALTEAVASPRLAEVAAIRPQVRSIQLETD